MAFFQFKNIRVAGLACAVPVNEVKTESYKTLFGDEEVEKFMEMTGVRASRRTSTSLPTVLIIVDLPRLSCFNIVWESRKRRSVMTLAWDVPPWW